MKRLKRILCIGFLIAVSIAVLSFLNIFTSDADKTILFVDFETYAVKEEDGTLTPMTADQFYAQTPDAEKTYVFTAKITEETYDDHIQFTPTGLDLQVWLGDTKVYQSQTSLPDEIMDQATARIPIRGLELPLTVTMECRQLNGINAIFPPMLFTTSDMTEMMPNLSWAHRGGIPTGAFAVIFLILVTLFLYTVVEEKPHYSILALIVASGILMVRGICAESGYLFLPTWMSRIFTRRELLWLLLIAFLIYFAINHKRIRLFGWCALTSGIIFAGTYLVSHISGGQFSGTVNEFLYAWIEYGEYTRPLLWVDLWLQFVCLLVAGITTIHTISEHIAREQSFELKAQLAMENYRVIEEQSRQDAIVRHEFHNHISALKLMLEQDKLEEARHLLAELETANTSTVKFTNNYAINAILQNVYTKAEELGFPIEIYARVDEDLPIPEQDLCGLLLNMFHNALEAVAQIDDPKHRQITIRLKQRDNALGIYCANTYKISPVFDHDGKLLSQKTERGHGLGISQMERIIHKYQGKLDISYSDDIFVAQTVLFLPQKSTGQ